MCIRAKRPSRSQPVSYTHLDATAALAHKGLGERARRIERALEIDIEHAVEGVIAHAHEQAIAGDASVVDERPNLSLIHI